MGFEQPNQVACLCRGRIRGRGTGIARDRSTQRGRIRFRLDGQVQGRVIDTIEQVAGDQFVLKPKRLVSACLRGQQAYWVCPLIEDNEDLELVALERRFSVLKAYDPNLNVEILHGKIAEDQKIKIMNSFINKEIHVLLATTVIEVGVDVPNASIMIVEGAERFGLAQLHQLRGRVGRGELPSSCTLVYSKNVSKLGKDRLEILRNNDNGFDIAEEDLRMRGGGDPLGLQQSGVPKFRLADLGVHLDILAWAQEDARKILKKNPDLKGTEGSNIRLLLFLMGREESLSLIRAS